jgi:hypothetical protein
VARDDPVGAVDQDRVGEPELAHRGRDLGHLGIRVRASVAGVRDQGSDLPVLDRQSRPAMARIFAALRSTPELVD